MQLRGKFPVPDYHSALDRISQCAASQSVRKPGTRTLSPGMSASPDPDTAYKWLLAAAVGMTTNINAGNIAIKVAEVSLKPLSDLCIWYKQFCSWHIRDL